MVKSKLASGEYATKSDVICAGLRALAALDAGTDRWLQDDVGSTFDEFKAHPDRALSLDEAMEGFHAHINALATNSNA